MRSTLVSALHLVALAGAAITTASAETPRFSERQLAQQQRMIDCSAAAKTQQLRGDARMAFMKTCLSGGQVTVEVGGESGIAPDRKPVAKPSRPCDAADCGRPQ